MRPTKGEISVTLAWAQAKAPGKAEQEREVAVNSLSFQLPGGADAFPGRGDLDQDSLPIDADGLVQVMGPGLAAGQRVVIPAQ